MYLTSSKLSLNWNYYTMWLSEKRKYLIILED